MKKVALLITFMLVFTLASFAQVDVTVEGSSELTFGIALDDPIATGFQNSNEAKISFTLASGTAEKGEGDGVYGWIEIADWKVELNSDDADDDDAGDEWNFEAGDVTAKIMFSMGWVQISGTNSEFTFVNPVQDDDGDNDNDDVGLKTALDNSGGLVLGLDFAPIAVELGVFSENDWTQDDTDAEYGWVDDDDDESTVPVWGETTAADASDNLNDEHAYGAALKVTLDVAPLTVEAGFVMGFNYVSSEAIGIGGKVSADIAPITAYVAVDFQIDGSDNSLEMGAGVSADIVDGFSVALDGSMGVEDVDDTDIRLTITEDGAGGFVPALGVTLTGELFNLMGASDGDDDPEWAAMLDVSYETDMMKPYVGVRYGTFTHDDDNDTYTYVAEGEEPFKLNVGVELYLVDNVTFTVDYSSDDLTSASSSNGVVKLITKIEY